MPTQSPQIVEPQWVRWDEVIIPFRFLDLSRIEQLELLPGHAHYCMTGQYPDDREPRPQDPFTAWVTMAHLGLLKKGVVHSELDPDLDREQRLAAAFELLTDDELLVVETIAVPKRYREMSAQDLAEMIRTAGSYIDRMWAACWLTLVGWTESEECTFRDRSETPQGVGDDLKETVIKACAESVNDIGAEVKLIGRRLGICTTHYSLNGPPPYECMKNTVPLGPEWEQIIRIVPKKSN